MFKLKTKYKPAGDQPQAIESLTKAFTSGINEQTLLGVTGSGKTFTAANIIQNLGKPTLVLAHNKTLAAQLFSEFKEYFPDNSVNYFVSYYDYYQPEAYVPHRDIYIEKETDINEDIERYRNAATQAALSRKDVIIVASVSCIYGLGNPEDYSALARTVKVGEVYPRQKLLLHLTDMQYYRSEYDFYTGHYRVRGDTIDINLVAEELSLRIEFFGEEIEAIKLINTLTGEVIGRPKEYIIYPAKQFVTTVDRINSVLPEIRNDLAKEKANFTKQGKLLEANRLEQRVNYDLEMLQEVGYCTGIENYSRYLDGRLTGTPPSTLLDYLGEDWLLIVDESHMTIPQVRGMYNGDRARKTTLVDYGFRLRAALDNRPLQFPEFTGKLDQVLYVSATPADYEVERVKQTGVVPQIIRPTGLLDPLIYLRPSIADKADGLLAALKETNHNRQKDELAKAIKLGEIQNQIDDLGEKIQETVAKKQRVLVTTLTKRMAEELSEYLSFLGLNVQYIHSDIDAIERVAILRDLRLGKYDVIVGINLLREGLDLPEVSLVCILDADKEGFLRSETSFVQTIGRAARHSEGRVFLYADKITNSMDKAITVTESRRKIQEEYNEKHGITPTTIISSIKNDLEKKEDDESRREPAQNSPEAKIEAFSSLKPAEKKKARRELKIEMEMLADSMEFERAAKIRDFLQTQT